MSAVRAVGQQAPGQKVGEARQALQEAETAALAITQDLQRNMLLNLIGEAQAQAGDLESAVAIAIRAYPHTTSTLNAIGHYLAASGQTAKAQEIGARLKGDGGATILFSMAVEQAEKGDIPLALRTAGHITAPEVRSYALKDVARCQVGNGDYAGARKTVAEANAAYPAQSMQPEGVAQWIAEAQIARGQVKEARATIANSASADMPDDMRAAALLFGVDNLLQKGDAANARLWLDEGLHMLPSGPPTEFLRYMALPFEVKLGLKERALKAVAGLSEMMRAKGYAAVAVTCAEMKDVAGMNAALEKLRAMVSKADGAAVNEFGFSLETLNVAAALVEAGLYDDAVRMIEPLEKSSQGTIKMLQPEAQMEHAVALAHQNKFVEARTLALLIRPDSPGENRRSQAWRSIALLKTLKDGGPAARAWAEKLADSQDRANAWLGIGQALLGSGDARLQYSAIQIH